MALCVVCTIRIGSNALQAELVGGGAKEDSVTDSMQSVTS